MSYFRLIKETDTEIHINTKGIEIPGIECVHVGKLLYKYSKRGADIIIKHSEVGTLTFEDGRIEKIQLSSFSTTEFILKKCHDTSD